MSAKLRVPTPVSETALLERYFNEVGVSGETILEAVDLILQRTEVFLNDALEITAETANFKSACAAGCGYCCHTLVSVAPPEAFFVARHIETTFDADQAQDFRERVTAYASQTKGMNGAERYTSRIPCPFLRADDWYCGLHTARPMVCRAMHSGNLQSCKTAYANRDANVPTPTMAIFFENTKAYMSAYISSLRPHGVAIYPVELSGALVAIWQTENAMNRWLGGEDIFAEAKIPTVERVETVSRRPG